jgi:hypothetical protein
MWIVTNKGLVSVVRDRNDPNTLLVRARQDGLLEEMIKEAGLNARVWQDEYADYPNRAKMSTIDFTDLLYAQVRRIDYPNFKNSVKNSKLHALYSRVWSVLSELGMGKFYGLPVPRGAHYPPEPKLSPEDAFFHSLPKNAFLDDGSLDPDYIQGT